MIKPNTKYKFTRGTVLTADVAFEAGFEFRTDRDGSYKSYGIPARILSIWLEDGRIEDTNLFKPLAGQKVYYVYASGSSFPLLYVQVLTYSPASHDKPYLAVGNAFRSLQDATECAAKMMKVMKEYYTEK